MSKDELTKKLQQINALSAEGLSILKSLSSGTLIVTKPEAKKLIPKKVDFSLNYRAFFKKYGKGKSGPKKFTLVIAFLSKGRSNIEISAETAKKQWNNVSGILGGKLTSGTFGTRAKENGWLNFSKHGLYALADKWKEIF